MINIFKFMQSKKQCLKILILLTNLFSVETEETRHAILEEIFNMNQDDVLDSLGKYLLKDF